MDIEPVPVLPRVEPDIVHLISEYLESIIRLDRKQSHLHCLSAGTGAGLLGLNIYLVVDNVVQHHVNLIFYFFRKLKLFTTPIILSVRHPRWSTVEKDFGASDIIFLQTGVIISIVGILLTIEKRIIFQVVLFS